MKKLIKVSALLVLFAGALVFFGCSLGGDDDNTPAPVGSNNPATGEMSDVTAKAIFDYELTTDKAGVIIKKFKNKAALENYLNIPDPAASVGVKDLAHTNLRIKKIEDKPVVEIAAGAFNTSAGAATLPEGLVSIQLPEELEALAGDAFGGELPSTFTKLIIPDVVAAKLTDEDPTVLQEIADAVADAATGDEEIVINEVNSSGDETPVTIPEGTYYKVTVSATPNGTVKASPASAEAGTEITLTINPNNGYRLKADTLQVKKTESGEDVTITDFTFTLPAANVTVSAEFESTGNLPVKDLVVDGINNLKNKSYDAAISSFETAYAKNNNDPEAIFYSSLAKLAAISTEPAVIDLMKNKLGFYSYPGTMNALLSARWKDDYASDVWGWSNWETGEEEYYIADRDSLPQLKIPNWFEGSTVYKSSLLANATATAETWNILLLANLLDKNTSGLNSLVDSLLSSAFGASFNTVAARVERLQYADSFEVDPLVTEALGLTEFFDEYKIKVGRPELDLLIASLQVIKASLEYLASYDLNTDLSFLKYAWADDDEGEKFAEALGKLSANQLPLRNNFMKIRSAASMTQSKNDYKAAVEKIIAVYDYLISDENEAYPPGTRDELKEYGWVKNGLTGLKDAIAGGGQFWIPAGDLTKISTWPTAKNQGTNFGIDMGKFFTAGYLSLNNVLEVNGNKPKFINMDKGENFAQELTSADAFDGIELAGIKLNATHLNALLLMGDSLQQDDGSVYQGDFFAEVDGLGLPSELAQFLFTKYQ
jgi:hypothetical protein